MEQVELLRRARRGRRGLVALRVDARVLDEPLLALAIVGRSPAISRRSSCGLGGHCSGPPVWPDGAMPAAYPDAHGRTPEAGLPASRRRERRKRPGAGLEAPPPRNHEPIRSQPPPVRRGRSRQHDAAALADADPGPAVALAPAAEDDLVAVLQERTALAARQP